MNLNKFKIIKEGREAGKHMKSFTDSIMSVADFMVTEPDEEKRAEARDDLKQWLNRMFPKK